MRRTTPICRSMAALLAGVALARTARADPKAPRPIASAPATSPSSSSPPARDGDASLGGGFELEHATTWDFDVEAGYGRYVGAKSQWSGLLRAQAGVLFVRDPVYDAIGVTYEYSPLANAAFGIAWERIRIDSGLWLHVGGLLDVSGQPGALASVGWSLFGLEAQVRSYEALGTGVGLYAKLRVPIGVIVHAMTRRSR